MDILDESPLDDNRAVKIQPLEDKGSTAEQQPVKKKRTKTMSESALKALEKARGQRTKNKEKRIKSEKKMNDTIQKALKKNGMKAEDFLKMLLEKDDALTKTPASEDIPSDFKDPAAKEDFNDIKKRDREADTMVEDKQRRYEVPDFEITGFQGIGHPMYERQGIVFL